MPQVDDEIAPILVPILEDVTTKLVRLVGLRATDRKVQDVLRVGLARAFALGDPDHDTPVVHPLPVLDAPMGPPATEPGFKRRGRR